MADRKPWKLRKLAKEYHARKDYAPYTMVWHRTIEKDIMNPSLPLEMRVLIAIRHLTWGNFSEWATEEPPAEDPGTPKPKPVTQEFLARLLQKTPGQISVCCTYLKDEGSLRKNHIYLVPEDHINPSESVNNSGVSSDSRNSSSSFLRYRKSVLEENKELAESIAKLAAERNDFQEKAKERTIELRKHDRFILAKWRDHLREHPEEQTEQNQQETSGEQNSLDSLRYCVDAQSSDNCRGEQKENCTYSNILESGSYSNLERFPTPEPPPMESEPYSAKIASKSRRREPRPFKSLNLEHPTSDKSVSQSTPITRLTDRQQLILDAIPGELLERLHDTPSPRLLSRIDQKLAGAPLPAFAGRIAARWLTISALGILASLADDVGRAHAKAEADRAEPEPERKPITKEEDEAYWTERYDRSNPDEQKEIAMLFPELFAKENVG